MLPESEGPDDAGFAGKMGVKGAGPFCIRHGARWGWIGLAVLAGCTGQNVGFAPSPRSPNFVVILTDDQRGDAMGCVTPWVRTPAMDALAARGVRFSNAFATTSLCSPSRASILTGRYARACGVPRLGGKLNDGERTVAHLLRDRGYRTAHVGKWHLQGAPAAAGFDRSWYFQGNGPHRNRAVVEEGRKGVTPGHVDAWVAERAVEYLQNAAKEKTPFVLFVNPQLPHMDNRRSWDVRPEATAAYVSVEPPVPASWNDGFRGKPPYLPGGRSRQVALEDGLDTPEGIRARIRGYSAAVTEVDDHVGRVLRAVDETGLSGRTIVIFASDNGWMIGEHGLTSKMLPYEASIRVPLIIAGPGIAPRVEPRSALLVDLAPTLLDLAGAPVPANVHGRSLAPILRGESTAWRDRFLYDYPVEEIGVLPNAAVRTEQWKYVRTEDPAAPGGTFVELYDLTADPEERENRAGETPALNIEKKLAEDLGRMRRLP